MKKDPYADPHISEECNELNYQYCHSVMASQEHEPEGDRVSALEKRFPKIPIPITADISSVPSAALQNYCESSRKRKSLFNRFYFWLHTKAPNIFKYSR